MGMYTELVFKAGIEDDLPQNVENVLQYLFGKQEEMPSELPIHDFFKCPRWYCIGRSSSYYHIPFVSSMYSDGHIFSRSDLKNYDNEIQLFLDWIAPYVDELPDTVVGWIWYEEYRVPKLVVNGGKEFEPSK